MSRRRSLSLWILVLAALGCAEGEAPELSQLEISTSPVVRGEAANGSVVVRDVDGLRGLELFARLESPVATPVPFAEPTFSDEDIEMPVAFALMLATTAPPGRYRLVVEAMDIDDTVSDEAIVEFDVE